MYMPTPFCTSTHRMTMRIGPANGTQHTELVKATLGATKEAILQQSGSEHLDAQADTRPAKGAVTHSCSGKCKPHI